MDADERGSEKKGRMRKHERHPQESVFIRGLLPSP
jgi:hypothetical protein